MKKNIWIFNHYAGPPSIASGTRHYNFARYLIKEGYSATIFVASTVHGKNINLISDNRLFMIDDNEGVPFVYINVTEYKNNGIKRILNMFSYYRGLFRVTKQFGKPDVIIGSSVHPLACVAAIKIAKKHKCECIVEIRDLWPESIVVYNNKSRKNLIIKLLYRLEKWIYEKADKIIFTMPGGKKYIENKGWDEKHGGNIELNKVYNLNNGVDLAEFKKNQQKNIIEDNDLENPNTFKIVYTGSVRLVNNIRRLVDAAVIINEKGLDTIKFFIYGDGSERIELENYCKTNHINNVLFKGPVNKKYIPYILSKFDAAFNEGINSPIFKYGSSANKQFDYFAAGLPVISAIKCWGDIIEKYNCGFVAVSDEPKALADSICDCFNLSKEESNRMRNNALHASCDFDFMKLSRQLIDIIETPIWA